MATYDEIAPETQTVENDLQSRLVDLKSRMTYHKTNVVTMSKDLAKNIVDKNKNKLLIDELQREYINLKNEAIIVSLNEFKKIKESIYIMEVHVISLENAIKSSISSISAEGKILKTYEKEIENCKKEIASLGKVYNINE